MINELNPNELNDDKPLANMATTPNSILERMLPKLYGHGDDLEVFINQCKRYFELLNKSKKNQERLIYGMIDDDLLEEYECTALRMAFGKPVDPIADWINLFQYRRNSENTKIYIQKVKTLVKRALSHPLSEEQLTAKMLVYCCNDSEVTKEAMMRDLEKTEEIEKLMVKIDAVHKVKNERINVVRSYSSVVQNPDSGIRPRMITPEKKVHFNSNKYVPYEKKQSRNE